MRAQCPRSSTLSMTSGGSGMRLRLYFSPFVLASDRAPRFVRRKCNIADMGWRKEEPLNEMLIEFCVHGHFYREEGNTNGVYG